SSTMASLKNIKFLVISDTHDLTLSSDTTQAFRTPAPKADVVLHCGDITENGSSESYCRAINLLSNLDAELKLVIAGNHDIDLDPTCVSQAEHEAAIKALTGSTAKDNGIIYLTEGIHTFTLSNSATFTIYASPYTPQYGESAFQYPSCEDRYNPSHLKLTPEWAQNVATATSTIPDNVRIDIVMTHGPPKYILDETASRNSGGCEHLRRTICRVKPLLHAFGHVHQGYGAQRVIWRHPVSEVADAKVGKGIVAADDFFVGKNSAKKKRFAAVNPEITTGLVEGEGTLMVNAAIRGEGGALNAPWLVELALPIA
ncbi:Metallo-dependent phosphatase, partial [Rhizodiscina lignyota]